MRPPQSILSFLMVLGLSSPEARSGLDFGTIVGVVRNEAGSPLAGVTIVVEEHQLRTTSDHEGRFRLERVPVGPVTVTARLLGYAQQTVRVTVAAGKAAQANVTLKAVPVVAHEAIVAAPAPMPNATRQARPFSGLLKARADVQSYAAPRAAFNTEEYKYFEENAWQAPARRPLSTFSIDVDVGSYTNVRRFINQGQLPPKDAVRVEEMINYFRYDYPDPKSNDPFSITTELSEAPWHSGHKLALIGLQGRRLSLDRLPPNNLVFLIDVSGSMETSDKLPLVKSAFRLLVNQLRPEDRVAIVVYAGNAGLVLPSTSGEHKDQILDAIEGLEAGGSTAGGAGIQLAYQVAKEHFLPRGNNRVILATDGDFNVGPSSEGELTRLIEGKREEGTFLTVLGFGTGNLKDAKMEQLAAKGNGHYAYVDNLLEAKKVFVRELGATLYTIAKDVKLQVEFNPSKVAAYRLVGYENRVMADQDFNDDRKDAGDLGAGHSVTALYEIVPVGAKLDVDVGTVDPLKYQQHEGKTARESDDWFTVKFRYKEPTATASRLIEREMRGETRAPSADFRFAAAVAGVGMLLRDSEHKGSASFDGMLALAKGAKGEDEDGYRAEFIRLMETAALIDKGQSRGRELTGRR